MKTNNKKETIGKINDIKSKLNNTFPMVIVLSIVCVILLGYIYTHKNDNAINIGSLGTENVTIQNIHYFKNDKMNYFYATPATFNGEDKNIYSFTIGYYVEDSKGELIPFLTRNNKFDKSTSLKDVVLEMTSWNIIELNANENYFNKEVNPYLHKLHFVITASTTKDGKNDITIDEKIDFKKML